MNGKRSRKTLALYAGWALAIIICFVLGRHRAEAAVPCLGDCQCKPNVQMWYPNGGPKFGAYAPGTIILINQAFFDPNTTLQGCQAGQVKADGNQFDRWNIANGNFTCDQGTVVFVWELTWPNQPGQIPGTMANANHLVCQ